ncbi:MAG: hypothetical protein Q9170_008368 [Blastenia crenularia]
MVHWSNDDLNVEPLERELGRVFSLLFNFTVEKYEIPAHTPGNMYRGQFQARLGGFVTAHQGPNSLLVYVYSGHADAGNSPAYDHCLWFGSRAEQHRNLDWAHCRPTADCGEGDVLFIFDCCWAATAAINKSENEYLVASSMEQIAGASPQTSFTQRLITVLKDNAGAGISVVSIHATMLANMKTSHASLEATPVHIGASDKPTIVLVRFNKTTKEVKQLHIADTKAAGKVLVSLKLHGYSSVPDFAQFEKWLVSHLPDPVASVRVEAAFESNSNIVLFTAPVELWDCLVGTEGFQFVDYVDSHNLLMQKDPTGLPLRQRQESNPPQSSSPEK